MFTLSSNGSRASDDQATYLFRVLSELVFKMPEEIILSGPQEIEIEDPHKCLGEHFVQRLSYLGNKTSQVRYDLVCQF